MQIITCTLRSAQLSEGIRLVVRRSSNTHPGHVGVEVRVSLAGVPRYHHQQARRVGHAQPHAAHADVDPVVVEGHLAEVQPPGVQGSQPQDDGGRTTGLLRTWSRVEESVRARWCLDHSKNSTCILTYERPWDGIQDLAGFPRQL